MPVPNSTVTSPWASDSLAYLKGPGIKPTYRVRTIPYQECTQHSPAHVLEGNVWQATNVEVTYTNDTLPYASASFNLPLRTSVYELGPDLGRAVEISAGWDRGGAAPGLGVIFYGVVVESVQTISDEGLRSVSVRCEGTETMWDHPFKSGTWNVQNSLSSITQQVAAMNAEPTRFYRSPLVAQVFGTLNTPTAAQLAVFRDMEIQAGENLQDWFVALAASLGQQLRGDHRHRIADPIATDAGTLTHDGVVYNRHYASAGWIVRDAAKADPSTYLHLEGLTDSISVRQSLDNYANWLQLTAKWGTSGSSTATFPSLDPVWGTPAGILKVAELTLNMRPSGGSTLLTTDPVGKALAYSYSTDTHRATITGRAVWWLECGHRVSAVVDSGPPSFPTWPNASGVVFGEVVSVQFHVDTGRMTIQIRPSSD